MRITRQDKKQKISDFAEKILWKATINYVVEMYSNTRLCIGYDKIQISGSISKLR